jgi:hypothetical protein
MVRPKSASAEAGNGQESVRLARLGALERIAKALELGRRGRRIRGMAHPAFAKGVG